MKKILIIVMVLVILFIYLHFESTTLKISDYFIKSDKLPADFEGYKIAHISDFHNTTSQNLKNKIIKSLDINKPDILVITGDLIDSRRTKINVSLDFIKNIKHIPIYYVAGNHESRIKEYADFKQKLKALGVIVLENEKIKLNHKNSSIDLVGLQDPSFETAEGNNPEIKRIVNTYLEKLKTTEDKFEILLLHRPELLSIYAKHNIDLVFSGHAHGGQIRLPLIGPIIAPNQGYFPKLTSGVNQKNHTSLIISRGIGNSLCPVRINNKPELVYVTLEK